MIVDQLEREKALDISQSFIVEAPAGSGKTGLLVQRFLRILSQLERPESVVAMTFTRKASAEMKERILASLNAATLPCVETQSEYDRKTFELAAAVLAQDKKKGWNLLEDPSRLQIQTIDSLSALITRQMPVLSDFGGVGEVIEQAEDLYLKAARETLVLLAEGAAEEKALLRRMVLHFDNELGRLERQIVGMLATRDQWEHLDSPDTDTLVEDCRNLLIQAEKRLRNVFQRAGKVDFTEIARAARRALGKPEQPSDLLYSLDYRLQHLLVDEFQDTSRSQYELVKALTEQWSLDDDHTLFIVGDPMQSIYRFREADVSLFLKCWHEQRIGAVRLAPLRLQTNFRTTRDILAWTEQHIAPLMPVDDVEQAAVAFRCSVANRVEPGDRPCVTAYVEDSGVQEANDVVKLIQNRPGRKIAILVRNRSHSTMILPALRRAGIAYEAIEIERLKDQLHILDLLSLTRALTNVADRVAWLACLRAPWCGLTLADLSLLAEGKPYSTIIDLLHDSDNIAALSVDGRWRVVRLLEILFDAVAQVGRLPLRDLVEQTWRRLGGPAIFAQANELLDAETLLGLIEEFDEGGVIRDFSLLNQRLENFFARPAGVNAAVTIMTVHQSKGLEFDIVIIPRLGERSRSEEKKLLVWAEQEDDLLIAALPSTGIEDPAYKRVADISKSKEAQELNRLFYVACTRAKNELHLFGNTKSKTKGTELAKPSKGTFLDLIWTGVETDFKKHLPFQVAPAKGIAAVAKRTVLHRLPVDWRAPQIPAALKAAPVLARSVASRRRVSFDWVGESRRHVGTVTHEILARVAEQGISAWPELRVLGLRDFIGSELARLGVQGGEVPEAAKQVLRAVGNMLSSKRGQWILHPHREARSEWALSGRLEETLISGTVDRAFFDTHGSFWIIDYKTGESRSVDRFLAAEKQRYQRQLEQYAALIARMIEAPIRLGLYFPLLDEWLEWGFARVASAAALT